MALTKKQLTKILEIIKTHYNGFIFEALGERELTASEISTLTDMGLLRAGTRHMIADPISIGRLIALVPVSARAGLTYEKALTEAKKVLPRTKVEEKAIEYATNHAGTHIKGIRDMTLRDVEAASARSSGAALRAVRQGVAEAIAKRQTVSELKTRLFELIDNRTRDWQRVAHTELNTAIQSGIHDEIVRTAGPDQLVYKRPSGGACKHCKRVYLKSDGTPRVFRISDLAESNVGFKSQDWLPVIGSVHPWCQCQLVVIPEGYDFKKTRVVKDPFSFDTREYKTGQVVAEEDYSRLGPTEQSKIGLEPVLTYTGKTASPDVEKSFGVFDTSDNCFCEHD